VELDGHNVLSDVFSEIGAAFNETGEGLLNLYATLDDASATSVGTDPQRQTEAQQQIYNTVDILTDQGKLEDALNAEYNEDAGNPTRQHTRQIFDVATLFIGGGGGASKAGLAGKAGTAGKAGEVARVGGAADRAGAAGFLNKLKDCLGNSFTPETQVLMADGSTKPIVEVDLGDQVLTTDAETGKTAAEPVAARITGNGVKHLVDIIIDTDGRRGDATSTITATDGHPFRWSTVRSGSRRRTCTRATGCVRPPETRSGSPRWLRVRSRSGCTTSTSRPSTRTMSWPVATPSWSTTAAPTAGSCPRTPGTI
jgi:hypothetical protein